jgi:spermidine synthase
MPYSDTRLDKKVSSVIRQLKPRTVLDIGPGAGKYGNMVKAIDKNIKIEAVEIDRSYVKKFKLDTVYDKIHIKPVQKFIDSHHESEYDLIIFGDVIEHLKKSEGVDALNFFVYRSKNIIVQWPHAYLQNAWEGHVHESHISVWGKSDFSNFKFKWHQKGFMRLVVIEGYLK